MAKTKRCPACDAEMPADTKDCPNCPFSFAEEDEAAPAPKSSIAPANWPPAAWLVMVGALALGAWQGLNFVVRHAGDESPRGAAAPEAASPGTVEITPAAAPAGDPARKEGASLPAREALPENPPASDDRPSEPELIAVTASSEAEEPLPAEWRLRGVVYDLESLKPLGGCTMVFLDAQTNSRRETVTDSQGRYRMIVPPLRGRGYSVAISHAGYAKAYLDPETAGVSRMSLEDRRGLSAELAKSLEGPYSVEPRGAEPKVTDFYLAPLAR